MSESCAIITTEANSVLRDIHDRMLVILGAADEGSWLDNATDKKEVLGLLQPCPEEILEAYPVATLVNSPRNNRPECVARVMGKFMLTLGSRSALRISGEF